MAFQYNDTCLNGKQNILSEPPRLENVSTGGQKEKRVIYVYWPV
jgi:hypothetical protein